MIEYSLRKEYEKSVQILNLGRVKGTCCIRIYICIYVSVSENRKIKYSQRKKEKKILEVRRVSHTRCLFASVCFVVVFFCLHNCVLLSLPHFAKLSEI